MSLVAVRVIMWDRQTVDFLDSRLVPWTKIESGHLGSVEGGRTRTLSTCSSGATTAIVRVNSPITGVTQHPLDMLILAGTATMSSQRLLPGAFISCAAGTRLDLEPLTTPLVIYVGSFGPPLLDATADGPDDARVLHLDDLAWQDMEWRGDEPPAPDVKIKWIRRDEEEGLGIAFLVGMLPGYQTSVEEAHPVYEESFKLHGDLLLGRRGIVGPGGYFFRPPWSWHGPLYSRYGNVSLIRKDGIGSTDYRPCLSGYDIEELKLRAYAGRLPDYLSDSTP